MAMTTCRECSHDVSTEARACPHCGTRGPTERAALNDKALGAVKFLLVFAALFVVLSLLG